MWARPREQRVCLYRLGLWLISRILSIICRYVTVRVRVFAGHFSITLFPCFLPLCPLLPPSFIVRSTFKPRFLDLAPLGPSLFLKCFHSLAPSGATEQLHSFGPTRTASYRYEPVYLSLCVAALPFSFDWPRIAPHRAGSGAGAHVIVR